jgi:hypothetical protein
MLMTLTEDLIVTEQEMKELTPLIPGFYIDTDGQVLLNMQEFMTFHGMPDSPGGRAVVWEEVRFGFGDTEVTEISDWDLLHRSIIIRNS